jgi:hypothetical protein
VTGPDQSSSVAATPMTAAVTSWVSAPPGAAFDPRGTVV